MMIILQICLWVGLWEIVVGTESPLYMVGSVEIIPNGTTYYLSYQKSVHTVTTMNVLFCFSQVGPSITYDESKEATFCPFNQPDSFDCLFLRKTNSQNTPTLGQYTLSDDFTRINPSNNLDVQLLDPTENEININFNNGIFSSAFYNMRSCYRFANGTGCSDWKLNYFHTYHHDKYINNLIVQRNHNCITTNNNNTHVHTFYGGVSRSGASLLFNAAVIVSINNNNFNMWGGFTYAFDHFNRDGVCFSTGNGEVYDIISLLASGAYRDTAENIGTEDNIEVVSNTYHEDYIESTTSYFVQYSRPYEIQDYLGDEPIIHKIYPSFSFVAYISYSDLDTVLSCQDASLKHQFVLNYPAIIDLYNSQFVVGVVFILLLMLA